MRITLDLHKGLEENAAIYYDKAKKAKSKLAGAKEAIKQTEKELQSVTKRHAQAEIAATLSPAPTHWYHKYHWSRSRSGHLLVGGTNADSNEALVKKHMEAPDYVLHTDMAGSPFVLLKPDGDVLDEDLDDAAVLVACYARAWREGLASIEVFHVRPDQVTKEAQSGEFLPKGAFMIRGDTIYHRPELVLGIGLLAHEDTLPEVFVGSPESCEAFCQKWVRVAPGTDKTSDVAKQLKKRLGGGDLDSFVRALPAGGCRIL